MNPPSLEETLRALFANETKDARAVLAEPRDANTPVKLAMRAGLRAAQTFLPVFQTVACKAGCGYCCRGVRVDVTAPEALTLARGFRESLRPEHLAVVRDRVARHAAKVRTMTLTERARERVPCPLLDEGRDLCTVHEARPLRCRAHHSLNMEDCKAVSEHPDQSMGITRYPDVMDGHEAMFLGQKRALVAAGLDSRSFDLALALEVALTHEDAAERWGRGERLFDAAAHTWPDERHVESTLPRVLLEDPTVTRS